MVKKVAGELVGKGDERVEGVVTKPGKYVGKFAESKHGKNIGSWAFMLGFLIALIAGVIAGLAAAGVMDLSFTVTDALTGFLVLIGLIVGIVNVSQEEAVNFLVAAIALMSASVGFQAMSAAVNVSQITAIASGVGGIGAFLTALTSMIAVFVAPAAVIVALKVIYSTARKAA